MSYFILCFLCTTHFITSVTVHPQLEMVIYLLATLGQIPTLNMPPDFIKKFCKTSEINEVSFFWRQPLSVS